MDSNPRLLYATRILLIFLILTNLIFIYGFSMQTAEQSSEVSGGISTTVAEVVVKDFESKPEAEKKEIVCDIDKIVRKLAHVAEYATLAAFTFMLLSTWSIKLPWRLLITLAGTALAGFVDERLVQIRSDGRSPQIRDILIDTAGGLLGCGAVILINWIIRAVWKKKSTSPKKEPI